MSINDGEEMPGRRRLREMAVPEDLYEEVMEFITRRRLEQRSVDSVTRSRPADGSDAAAGEAVGEDAPGGDATWDEESLRGLLEAQNTNGKLIRALVALARNPEHRLSTEQLVTAANTGAERHLEPGRAWGGFLARAQTSSSNHFGLPLPIDKASWDGRWTYSMEPRIAEIICRWADETRRFP